MGLYITNPIQIRPAILQDAEGISRGLAAIIVSWYSDRACDPTYVTSHHIAAADQLTCTVALDPQRHGMVLGFQSLKLAQAKNIYGVTPGWGVIGTYVALDTGRKGIGKQLFDATFAFAQQAGLSDIDATIGAENAQGIAYYEAMGFQTYRRWETSVSKRFTVRLQSG